MNNLKDLKKRIDNRNKVLQKIMLGDHVIFEIKNNFFLGGIFQEAISKIDTKKISKMSKSKQEEEIKNNIDTSKLFKAIENAIKDTYTIEEYKDIVNDLKEKDEQLNDFLDSITSIEDLYDIQLGLNNDNLELYFEVLNTMIKGIDKKKQVKK